MKKHDNAMPSTNTELKQAPWLKNADGNTRRIGVEIEMSGLDLDTLAGRVAGFFGLNRHYWPAAWRLGSPLGRYREAIEDPFQAFVVACKASRVSSLG